MLPMVEPSLPIVVLWVYLPERREYIMFVYLLLFESRRPFNRNSGRDCLERCLQHILGHERHDELSYS